MVRKIDQTQSNTKEKELIQKLKEIQNNSFKKNLHDNKN